LLADEITWQKPAKIELRVKPKNFLLSESQWAQYAVHAAKRRRRDAVLRRLVIAGACALVLCLIVSGMHWYDSIQVF
jgi:type IV secretory pathway component VirB8